MRKRLLAGNLILMVLVALILVPGASAGTSAGPAACDNRVNNTVNKLLECVTLDGVREHQAAFQEFADANGGTRASGTPGYDESVDYVVERMEAAGYNVSVQDFEFHLFEELGPSTLDQTAPGAVSYAQGVDFDVMSQSEPGDVTAAVTPVDLQLGLGNASSSGCEAADFAGFPAGNIALIQRGTCTFEAKAENAAAAGAAGVIIFNQGNTPARLGLIGGTVGDGYTGGVPVFDATYARGEEWAGTAGLVLHMVADVSRVLVSTNNVFAESPSGDPDHVVMAGAHLDSVAAGPGIQDNGSGSAALLEVAEEMAKVNPRYQVRFAWWGAEEASLVGSTFYVNSLSQEELDSIALYLNFDMIGSPNHVFFIYDGDDSDGEGAGPGPDGSAEIEQAFEAYFNAVDEPFKGTDFSGRSDYGPFIAAGIPSGGLFTGAEGIKTAEEAGIWGGTAGVAYDSCYHQACDTYDNVNLDALDVNSDAVAFATLQFAMNLENIIGEHGKGNFNPDRWGDLNIK
jgi:Zn-dependent M28 family amino/carboxypeptidase